MDRIMEAGIESGKWVEAKIVGVTDKSEAVTLAASGLLPDIAAALEWFNGNEDAMPFVRNQWGGFIGSHTGTNMAWMYQPLPGWTNVIHAIVPVQSWAAMGTNLAPDPERYGKIGGMFWSFLDGFGKEFRYRKLVPYAWPGGYRIVYYLKDGDELCCDCAEQYGYPEEFFGCGLHEEGAPLFCKECNRKMTADYGDPEASEAVEKAEARVEEITESPGKFSTEYTTEAMERLKQARIWERWSQEDDCHEMPNWELLEEFQEEIRNEKRAASQARR